MDPVVHFEMPYDDRQRMAAFYNKAFGWQTEMLGDDFGNYAIATTTETENSAPTIPGTINGGFYERKADWPAQHPTVVIAVQNIVEAMARIRAAGGKVLGDPMNIPTVGAYVSFLDSEGNRVSVLEPLPRN